MTGSQACGWLTQMVWTKPARAPPCIGCASTKTCFACEKLMVADDGFDASDEVGTRMPVTTATTLPAASRDEARRMDPPFGGRERGVLQPGDDRWPEPSRGSAAVAAMVRPCRRLSGRTGKASGYCEGGRRGVRRAVGATDPRRADGWWPVDTVARRGSG